jgi:hypothetical protein
MVAKATALARALVSRIAVKDWVKRNTNGLLMHCGDTESRLSKSILQDGSQVVGSRVNTWHGIGRSVHDSLSDAFGSVSFDTTSDVDRIT